MKIVWIITLVLLNLGLLFVLISAWDDLRFVTFGGWLKYWGHLVGIIFFVLISMIIVILIKQRG